MFDEDFDKSKSNTTKAERGVDFVEARTIWNDPDAVTIPAKPGHLDEIRNATVGKMGEKLWVAIWTLRGELIRIISVRRAEGTPFERKYYE